MNSMMKNKYLEEDIESKEYYELFSIINNCPKSLKYFLKITKFSSKVRKLLRSITEKAVDNSAYWRFKEIAIPYSEVI